MPKVCSIPANATVIRLHSVTFSTFSGIQTVKGTRAVSPAATVIWPAVMACTQPLTLHSTGPSSFSAVWFSTLSTHWRAWPGRSTGCPMKETRMLFSSLRVIGTAAKGAAVMLTGRFSPRLFSIAMQESPARDTRAAMASPTSVVEGAPVSSPRNAAASRSG